MSRKKQAEKIKADVVNWSKTVLEPMNKHIGFPACPFAAKWRKDKKVRIEVRMDKSKYEKQLTSVIKSWNKKQRDIIRSLMVPILNVVAVEEKKEKIILSVCL